MKKTKRSSIVQKRIGKAIRKYNMIEDGDKILVGVSGGKDSLVMLKLLKERIRWSPAKYELHAVHVISSLNPQPELEASLEDFFKELDVPYSIKKMKIGKSKRGGQCFWCSWNRRKVMFNMADEMGFNKIALGHHKDDIIETMMMNILFNGNISTMNPVQELFNETLHVIRPLCFCEEEIVDKMAKACGLVKVKEECPFGDKTTRLYIKELIRGVEEKSPYVRENIFRSLMNIRKDYIDVRE